MTRLDDASGHGAVVGALAARLACTSGQTCSTELQFKLLLAGGTLGTPSPSSARFGTFFDFIHSAAAAFPSMSSGDVANFSVGFEADDGPGPEAVRAVVAAMVERGVHVVAAAGNRRGLPGDQEDLMFPAGFDHVLAVGGLRSDGRPLAVARGFSASAVGAPGFRVPQLPDFQIDLPAADARLDDVALAGSSVAAAVVSGLLARGLPEDELVDTLNSEAYAACLAEHFHRVARPSPPPPGTRTVTVTPLFSDAPRVHGVPASDDAVIDRWRQGRRVAPVGVGLLPQPLDPSCSICVIFNRTGSAFDFHFDPNQPTPTPAPVQYWLRLVPAGGEAELLDVTAQALNALGAGPGQNTVNYSSVPDPKGGASLITVYADPNDPDALYTYEEEVDVYP